MEKGKGHGSGDEESDSSGGEESTTMKLGQSKAHSFRSTKHFMKKSVTTLTSSAKKTGATFKPDHSSTSATATSISTPSGPASPAATVSPTS